MAWGWEIWEKQHRMEKKMSISNTSLTQLQPIETSYKVCEVCGKVFRDRREYEERTVPLRHNPEYPHGNMPDEENSNHYLELRNCSCGATLCVRRESKRDMSPIGQLRRELFNELAEFYMDKYQISKNEANLTVYEKYRLVFRAHINDEE